MIALLAPQALAPLALHNQVLGAAFRGQGETAVELLTQLIVVHILANEDQLIFLGSSPLAVVQREALTTEMEDVALLALLKPKNALRSKDTFRQLVVEEMLELANGKGAIALNRQ